ncbi:MAG: AAA family ATPase [Pseudomonadota bacterium]|nr:AAA family ATPase [Pseudomonadota bacterium]
MRVQLSGDALVFLVGCSGSGKSTFCETYFQPSQVVSSDQCRKLVSDREEEQQATQDAFTILYQIVEKRIRRGLFTVIDATNLEKSVIQKIKKYAEVFKRSLHAFVFSLPLEQCLTWNNKRPKRQVVSEVIYRQHKAQQNALEYIIAEEITHTVLTSVDAINAIEIEVKGTQIYTQAEKHIIDDGPFDIIGDVHGCLDELNDLLSKLGYVINRQDGCEHMHHPQRRKVIFVGDLVDRGPNSVGVINLVRQAVADGVAYAILGNHDEKLKKKLRGKKVKVRHGLETTLAELERVPESERQSILNFLVGLPYYSIFAGGKLVVAHAGILEKDIGEISDRIKRFCLYGDITGKTNEFGFPIRGNWAKTYQGEGLIVYGHTPVRQVHWENNSVNIDTACVFGGALTALQYPEKKCVSVNAHASYAEDIRSKSADQS